MNDELQPKELVFCNGSQRLGAVVGFSGMFDYDGCALWELTDGMGRFWLCPYYLIKRLPGNWDQMSLKAKVAYNSIR